MLVYGSKGTSWFSKTKEFFCAGDAIWIYLASSKLARLKILSIMPRKILKIVFKGKKASSIQELHQSYRVLH